MLNQFNDYTFFGPVYRTKRIDCVYKVYIVVKIYDIMGRKMIALDEEVYRELVKAKGKMEMMTGQNISLGQAIGVAAGGVLTGIGVKKLLESLTEED